MEQESPHARTENPRTKDRKIIQEKLKGAVASSHPTKPPPGVIKVGLPFEWHAPV